MVPYGTASGEPVSMTEQKPALDSAGQPGQVESGLASSASSLFGSDPGDLVDSRALSDPAAQEMIGRLPLCTPPRNVCQWGETPSLAGPRSRWSKHSATLASMCSLCYQRASGYPGGPRPRRGWDRFGFSGEGLKATHRWLPTIQMLLVLAFILVIFFKESSRASDNPFLVTTKEGFKVQPGANVALIKAGEGKA